MSQQEAHLADCTVAAVAMCVGVTYAEALVAIAQVSPKVLQVGATWPEIRRAVKRFGVTLVERRDVDVNDVEEEGGMLSVQFKDGVQHAVYFKRGLIFDGRSEAVWDADVYLRVNRVRVVSLLVMRPL